MGVALAEESGEKHDIDVFKRSNKSFLRIFIPEAGFSPTACVMPAWPLPASVPESPCLSWASTPR